MAGRKGSVKRLILMWSTKIKGKRNSSPIDNSSADDHVVSNHEERAQETQFQIPPGQFAYRNAPELKHLVSQGAARNK